MAEVCLTSFRTFSTKEDLETWGSALHRDYPHVTSIEHYGPLRDDWKNDIFSSVFIANCADSGNAHPLECKREILGFACAFEVPQRVVETFNALFQSKGKTVARSLSSVLPEMQFPSGSYCGVYASQEGGYYLCSGTRPEGSYVPDSGSPSFQREEMQAGFEKALFWMMESILGCVPVDQTATTGEWFPQFSQYTLEEWDSGVCDLRLVPQYWTHTGLCSKTRIGKGVSCGRQSSELHPLILEDPFTGMHLVKRAATAAADQDRVFPIYLKNTSSALVTAGDRFSGKNVELGCFTVGCGAAPPSMEKAFDNLFTSPIRFDVRKDCGLKQPADFQRKTTSKFVLNLSDKNIPFFTKNWSMKHDHLHPLLVFSWE